MFLATTALSEFWDKDQEILFLGSWCLRYDRRSEWERLKYQVLPSPWEDRKRFYDATIYLDECGERMLRCLTDYLNSVHGLSKPTRYWRILLGPWLLHSLHVTYDRYVHLTEALNRYSDLQTIVLDPQSFQVPRTTQEFIEFALDDPFNLQIFSQLLQGMGYDFPTRALCNSWPETVVEPEKARWQRIAQRMAKHGVSRASQIIGRMRGHAWQVGMCELGWSQSAIWRLAWRSGLQALPLEVKSDWSFSVGDRHCDDRRKNLAGLPGSDEFERIFVKSLPQNFPNLYLESFREARDETLRKARQIPKVLVSSAGWYANEPYKFLAAESMERGSRLVTAQLGGGYGMYRFSAPELHEARVGDSFMVWGWADAGPGKCRNLPSPKLSPLITSRPVRLVNHETEKILFVSSAHIRYLFRFHSCPIGIQNQAYFQWQLRFLTAMPARIRLALLFRDYPEDYGHATRERISIRFADVQWDDSSAFLPQLQDSRLAVIDHAGTTFLEALRLGVPTILFWDPHWTEVRDEAEPYFESLRKVGILWDSPEAAAKKAAEIYDDAWSWWGSEAVQEVRKRFVDRYALARKDWVNDWAKALEEEIASAQVPEK